MEKNKQLNCCEENMSENSKILNVGIIGLRHLHPRSYMPLFEAVDTTSVVAVAEQDQELLESFAADFSLNSYADYREMLDKEELDFVAIFLPHSECAGAVVECANRKVHVIVEKPMAAKSGGVGRMIQAVNSFGIKLTTAYLWRYHPVSRAIKKQIDAGMLGDIVGCEGRCAAGGLHRYIEGKSEWMLKREISGGGPMYNLGVHWIDLYRWFLDDEVVEVTGKNVHVNKAYDIEDNSFAILTFSKGTVVALDISYTVPDSYPHGRDLYLSLKGTAGAIEWSPAFESTDEKYYICSDSGGFGPGLNKMDVQLPKAAGYCGSLGVEFISDFARNVIDDSEVLINADDGLQALRVVEAIYESAQTGKHIKLDN
jgi:UDP-N-acetyl-2-amino-2-deoxyglucuronate dehydrogenase